MNFFGIRLSEQRKQANLTRKQLANKLNISERAISYWENGERECDFSTLIALSKLFHVSVDYLIGNSEFE